MADEHLCGLLFNKDRSSAKAPTLPDAQRRGGWGTRGLSLKRFILNGCPILAPSLSMDGIDGREVGARVGLLAI
ncbi:MAG: hypothetical protein DMG28_14340 [Acidobacteria bacterium]|nr:MAG: hypothetical protein DMG28_14340 [Acidobacteriota bacterium]